MTQDEELYEERILAITKVLGDQAGADVGLENAALRDRNLAEELLRVANMPPTELRDFLGMSQEEREAQMQQSRSLAAHDIAEAA